MGLFGSCIKSGFVLATSSVCATCFKISGVDWHLAIRGSQAAEDMVGVQQDVPEVDDEAVVRKLLLDLRSICCLPCLCPSVHACCGL
jgi:hypothetical protein